MKCADIPPGSEICLAPVKWVFLRIDNGIAYWMESNSLQEVSVGDVLFLCQGCRGILRSSQLSGISVHWFGIDPQLAGTWLTIDELRFIEIWNVQNKCACFIRRRPHALPEQFANLIDMQREITGLALRCHMMLLLAIYLAEIHAPKQECKGYFIKSKERFQQLANQLIAEDMLAFKIEELAGQCGCGTRYFSRLFRHHFGRTFRSVQTMLRLQKARRLLQFTDRYVANIALECGYQNTNLFNALFKRHFGITPSDWRMQSVREKIVLSSD